MSPRHDIFCSRLCSSGSNGVVTRMKFDPSRCVTPSLSPSFRACMAQHVAPVPVLGSLDEALVLAHGRFPRVPSHAIVCCSASLLSSYINEVSNGCASVCGQISDDEITGDRSL